VLQMLFLSNAMRQIYIAIGGRPKPE